MSDYGVVRGQRQEPKSAEQPDELENSDRLAVLFYSRDLLTIVSSFRYLCFRVRADGRQSEYKNDSGHSGSKCRNVERVIPCITIIGV